MRHLERAPRRPERLFLQCHGGVYRSDDAGATWTPRDDGLPQGDAYLCVLRQSFAATGEGDSLELYFGATSGEIVGSGDAGATWFGVAQRLPAIASGRPA